MKEYIKILSYIFDDGHVEIVSVRRTSSSQILLTVGWTNSISLSNTVYS